MASIGYFVMAAPLDNFSDRRDVCWSRHKARSTEIVGKRRSTLMFKEHDSLFDQ